MAKRGRPKLPRDAAGNIIRDEPPLPPRVKSKAELNRYKGTQNHKLPVNEYQSAANACILLGYTTNELRKLAGLGMPVEEGENVAKAGLLTFKVRIPAAVRWLIQNHVKQAVAAFRQQLDQRRDDGEDLPLSKTEEELRLLKANADVRAHHAQLLAHETVEIDAVMRGFTTAVLNLRAAYDGKAGRRAGEFSGITSSAQIRQIMLEDDKRALDGFAADMQKALDRLMDRDAEEIEAASEVITGAVDD